MKELHERNLIRMRGTFEQSLDQLKGRCEERLGKLQMDLELRRRVDLHEIEERKNNHINQLVTNHKRAFEQTKNYYNDITRGNIQLIRNLKEQVAELRRKGEANAKLLAEYTLENDKLAQPLADVASELADLQSKLRDREKDKLALRNVKARLRMVERELDERSGELGELERDHRFVEGERDEIKQGFEHSVEVMRGETELQTNVLEQKLKGLESQIQSTAEQSRSIMQAAGLDEGEMARVMRALSDTLDEKQGSIQHLQYGLVKSKKKYNDTLRTVASKLLELGIPQEEIDNMGFDYENMPVESSQGPSGLVAS